MTPSWAEQGTAKGQEQSDNGSVLFRLKNPGRHGGHGVTSESQDHGQDRLPIEPHLFEDLVGHDREPRQVSGILHEAEDQKEIAHDGKDDGNRIGQGHREKTVRTDEKFLKKGDGDEPLNQAGQRRKDPLPEDGLFQKFDTDLGPEDPDKFIGDEQNEEQDGDSPEGMDRKVSKRDGEAFVGLLLARHHLRQNFIDLSESGLVD